jgi:two-component system, NtrC family, nitrogen regulation response regulator NtrX
MTKPATETVLIVDDEESVRRTFREWLGGAGFDCEILAAHDAESALQLANTHTIDLAILDWALGAGDDGLQLLQDLSTFHPDVVAILVTGYANQATPLDAMRMGVRDYLDKNQDLNRESFLKAVRKQLERIRPAKRARRLNQSLLAFRETVEKILPLVQSTATLNDPVPLPDAVRSLVRFLMQMTRAAEGVLLVRHYDPARQPAETCKVYDAEGKEIHAELVPFARSLAGSAVSMQQPCAMNDLMRAGQTLELHSFEKPHRAVLAVPMTVVPGIHAVLELFDKPGSFSDDDIRLVRTAAELGTELLRQALGQRQMHQLLLDAVAAALGASTEIAETLPKTSAERLAEPPPSAVLDQLRQGLAGAGPEAAESLRLAEAIRVLALRHGPGALEYCLRLVENTQELLDKSLQSD